MHSDRAAAGHNKEAAIEGELRMDVRTAIIPAVSGNLSDDGASFVCISYMPNMTATSGRGGVFPAR